MLSGEGVQVQRCYSPSRRDGRSRRFRMNLLRRRGMSRVPAASGVGTIGRFRAPRARTFQMMSFSRPCTALLKFTVP